MNASHVKFCLLAFYRSFNLTCFSAVGEICSRGTAEDNVESSRKLYKWNLIPECLVKL